MLLRRDAAPCLAMRDESRRGPGRRRQMAINIRSISGAAGRGLAAIRGVLVGSLLPGAGGNARAVHATVARALVCGTLGIDTVAGGNVLTGLALSRAPAGVTSLAADRRHVSTIAADGFSALPTGDTRFLRRELVGRTLRVRCSSTLGRNLTLFRRIHRRKTAL